MHVATVRDHGMYSSAKTNQPTHTSAPTHNTLHHAKALNSYIRKLGVLNQYHRCALQKRIRRRCPHMHSQQHPPEYICELVS